jgi:hypothetical protein
MSQRGSLALAYPGNRRGWILRRSPLRYSIAVSMGTPFQFVRGAMAGSFSMRRRLTVLLAGIVLLCPLVARAQDAPQGAVGRVDGKDISVESGTPGGNGTSIAAASIYVVNGSVVTVHSGNGRMTLFGGGEVEICGPAKFTVLLSGDDITLALNFGRLRVRLPESSTLRVFTPTIIGTPLGISGAARDVTVGLNLDDSLCVAAASGAIQLEHQFTGEKLIVPQAGEFFLNAGRLMPVAGTPGSCQCTETDQRAVPAPAGGPLEYATNAAPPAEPTSAPAVVEAAAAPNTVPTVEFSIPAHANEGHPIVPQARDEAPTAPPTSVPIYTVLLPPLVFMANSPAPPPIPTADMAVLVREAQVSPEWEFTGRVEAPEFAQEMQRALGEGAPEAQTTVAATQSSEKPKKRKGGFWASLKRVFGGGGG